MYSFSDNVIEFVYCLVESSIFFNFFSSIFIKKKQSKFIYSIVIILYAMVIYLSTNMSYFSNAKLIFTIIVLILFVVIFYYGEMKSKILFAFIAVIVMILSDIVVANILMIIMKIDLEKMLLEQGWGRVFLVCLCKMLVFMILRVISCLINKVKLNVPVVYWYMILCIFTVLFIVLIVIGKIGVMSQYYFDKSIYFIICSTGILIITVFVNYIVIKLSKYYEKEQEYKVIELKNEIMGKYYLEKEELYKETRKLRHDFKNHMICILSLIKNNKIQEGIEYIESLNDVIISDVILIRSGNDIVDAVLNQKITLAKEANIKINADLSLPKEIKIKDIDLLSILGNVIDNAIEASINLEDEVDKKIDIKINKYKDYILINVSNIVKKDPISGIKKYISSKKDKKNHGLGIKIINNIVEKYDGTIEYIYVDDIFIVKILIKDT